MWSEAVPNPVAVRYEPRPHEVHTGNVLREDTVELLRVVFPKVRLGYEMAESLVPPLLERAERRRDVVRRAVCLGFGHYGRQHVRDSFQRQRDRHRVAWRISDGDGERLVAEFPDRQHRAGRVDEEERDRARDRRQHRQPVEQVADLDAFEWLPGLLVEHTEEPAAIHADGRVVGLGGERARAECRCESTDEEALDPAMRTQCTSSPPLGIPKLAYSHGGNTRRSRLVGQQSTPPGRAS